MLGSVDALEPGFRPGARWGLGSPEHGGRRTHQVFVPARAGGVWRAGGSGMRWWGLARSGARRALGVWRMLGALARWGSGVRWGPAHAGALAR